MSISAIKRLVRLHSFPLALITREVVTKFDEQRDIINTLSVLIQLFLQRSMYDAYVLCLFDVHYILCVEFATLDAPPTELRLNYATKIHSRLYFKKVISFKNTNTKIQPYFLI